MQRCSVAERMSRFTAAFPAERWSAITEPGLSETGPGDAVSGISAAEAGAAGTGTGSSMAVRCWDSQLTGRLYRRPTLPQGISNTGSRTMATAPAAIAHHSISEEVVKKTLSTAGAAVFLGALFAAIAPTAMALPPVPPVGGDPIVICPRGYVLINGECVKRTPPRRRRSARS